MIDTLIEMVNWEPRKVPAFGSLAEDSEAPNIVAAKLYDVCVMNWWFKHGVESDPVPLLFYDESKIGTPDKLRREMRALTENVTFIDDDGVLMVQIYMEGGVMLFGREDGAMRFMAVPRKGGTVWTAFTPARSDVIAWGAVFMLASGAIITACCMEEE